MTYLKSCVRAANFGCSVKCKWSRWNSQTDCYPLYLSTSPLETSCTVTFYSCLNKSFQRKTYKSQWKRWVNRNFHLFRETLQIAHYKLLMVSYIFGLLIWEHLIYKRRNYDISALPWFWHNHTVNSLLELLRGKWFLLCFFLRECNVIVTPPQEHLQKIGNKCWRVINDCFKYRKDETKNESICVTTVLKVANGSPWLNADKKLSLNNCN